MDFQGLVGLGVTMVTGIVGITTWNVKLQGRLNEHDRVMEEREKQADERHEDLKSRLVRIETKLDSANGGRTYRG